MKYHALRSTPTRFAVLAVLALAVLWQACGEPAKETDPPEKTPAPVERPDEAHLEKARNIIVTMPSPFETLTLLKHAGVPYEQDILNPIENLNHYKRGIDQAVNLGIYGTDLSYSSVFEENEASIRYLACVAKLTEELGIQNAFSPTIMDRLMANKTNNDSVQQIVSAAYYNANGLLKDRDEEHVAAVILAGGWIEGLYIATQLQKAHPDNEDLLFTISDQKYALENLLELLETFDGHGRILELSVRLKELMPFYEGTGQTAATAEHSTKDGTTVIGGDNSNTMSGAQLAAIADKVAEIRNDLIRTAHHEE